MKKTKKILKFSAILVLVFALCFFAYTKFIAPNSKKLNDYQIKINYNDTEKTLDCTEEIKFYNTQNLEILKFHLYPKAFSETAKNQPVGLLYTSKAYPNGKNYGDILINEVKVDNENINYYFEGEDSDILVVKLPEKSQQNKSNNIFISFNVKLPNINHRFGYGENVCNVGNFYPILCVYENGEFSVEPYSQNGDPFYSDMSNYYVEITYPSNFVLASTGNILKNEDIALNRTSYITAQNVRDFAFCISQNFKVATDTVDKTQINYFYYNDQNPETSLKTCTDALKTFNKLFGKYPYKQLSVCETNFVYGGMEYPNLVYISDDIANYEDYINTIVHEIAHQWWYGLVGNNEFEYGWLDEGLTEYSTVLFYENNPEYNITRESVVKTSLNSYLLFEQVYSDVFGNVDSTMNRKLNEYNTEPEYVYIAYVKGLLMMNDIRDLIGYDNFVKSLKYYFKNYSGKNATPEDFISSFEKVTNRQIASFVQSYIDGKVVFTSQ